MRKIGHYISNGFIKIGCLTISKPEKVRERKHGVYFVGNAPKSKGVYILSKGESVLKFGDTNASKGMYSRINMYLSNSESTNLYVRQNLFNDLSYDVYFYEISPELVPLMGLLVEQSLSPRSLEKELIEEYFSLTGSLPELNKINK